VKRVRVLFCEKNTKKARDSLQVGGGKEDKIDMKRKMCCKYGNILFGRQRYYLKDADFFGTEKIGAFLGQRGGGLSLEKHKGK